MVFRSTPKCSSSHLLQPYIRPIDTWFTNFSSDLVTCTVLNCILRTPLLMLAEEVAKQRRQNLAANLVQFGLLAGFSAYSCVNSRVYVRYALQYTIGPTSFYHTARSCLLQKPPYSISSISSSISYITSLSPPQLKWWTWYTRQGGTVLYPMKSS
jgi:ABC-type uncharacterized transport system permease subunit